MITFGGGLFGAGVYGGGGSITPTAAQSATITGRACELELDPSTWDIKLPGRLLRGPDAIIQRIQSRLWFASGEWFLDTRQGVPYFDQILVKNPRLPVIAAIFRSVIGRTPGVVRVGSVRVTPGTAVDRTGRVDWEAVLDDSTVVTASEEPLIVRERGAA